MVKAGTAYIDIEGDFTPLERQVARKTAKSAGTAHVDVDANTQPLDRKLDATQRKLQDLGRNAMSGMGDGFGTAARDAGIYERAVTQAAKATDLWQDSQGRWRNSVGRFASDAEKAAAGIDDFGRRSQRGSGGIDAISSAVSGLGGGFGRLASSMAIAAPPLVAFGGAAAAVVSALGPLVGLGPAAAVGLTAIGQAAGVAALASIGIGDALKEQLEVTGKAAQAAVASGEQQRAAARAVAQAQEGVRNATDRVATASDSLTAAERAQAEALRALAPAQAQARRALQDMHSALTNAALNEEGAVLGLKDARTALAHAQSPQDAQALLAAQERLTGSIRNQQEAVRGLVGARERLDELTRPPDALTLADAQDAVADSTRGQERAALDLVDAREKLARLISPATDEERAQAALNVLKAQEALTKVNANAASTEGQRQQAALNLAKAQKQLEASQTPPGTEEDIARAKLAVADAENAIGDASRQSTKAQAALSKLQNGPDQKAVAAAKQDIADAEQNVADAAADTAKAEKAVQDAQRGADPTEVARAKHDVAVAEQALADATRDRARLEKDVAAADKAGVNGSQEVIAAKQRITEADHRLATAQKDYRDAMRDVARAEQAAADARADAKTGMAATALAAEDLNEKMNGLPPAAQAFVRELVALKPRLDEIRGVAAAGLFPGVTAGIQSAMKNFEPLKRVVAATAEVLGGLAERAGELVGSAGFGRDLETIGGRNALIIDRLGHGAIYLGDALRHLLVAAGPLTTWLAKVALGWAKNADEAAKAGRESGKLSDFFQSTRNTLIKVASIVGNLAVAFFNVGKAAAPFGRDILDVLDKVTGKFADWTKSISGQSALQDFFRESNQLLGAFLPVIGEALKSLGQMAFFVLPAYVAILKLLGPLAAPLLQTFIALKLAATAASAIGALAAFANPIGLVVLALVGLGAGFAIAYKKSEKFRDVVQGVWEMVKKATGDALNAVRGWMDLGGEDTDNLKDSLSNLGKAAQWVFEKVLEPVARRVFPILRDYFHGVVDEIAGMIKIVTGVLSGDWSRAWEGVKQVVEGVFRTVYAIVGGAAGILFDLGKLAVGGLIDGLQALPGALLDAGVWIVKHLDDAIIAQYKLIYDIGKWLITTAISGFQALPQVVSDAARWLRDTLKTAVTNLAGSFKNRGEDVLGWAVEGFKSLPGKIATAAVWLRDTLKTTLEDLSATFTNRGKDVIGWIADGLQTLAAKLVGFPSWLRDTLKTALEDLAGGFVNRGADVLGWLVDGLRPAAEALPTKLANFGTWLTKTLGDLLNGAVKGFTGLGESIMGWIIDGLKTGAYELQGFLNKIIGLINKIPGLEDIPKINVLTKDPKTGVIKGFARGGAFARTGGYVNQPMTFMGEEAPRHPEFVIPTNPAYKDRARALLAQAANAIGFANGGIWNRDELKGLWRSANPGVGDPNVMSAVSLAESSGDQHAVGHDPGGTLGLGLWQVTTGFNDDLIAKYGGQRAMLDSARANADAAGDLFARQGIGAWAPSRPRWEAILSGGGGILGKIGGAIRGAVDALNPLDLISKLPDVGGLGWLKDTGKYILGKVAKYIKDKLGSLVPGGGGATSGPNGIGAFRGVPMANWVIESLKHAEKKLGTDLHPTSGWRSQAEQDAIRARDPRAAKISEHLGTQYPKGAVDFGGFTDTHAKAIKDAVVSATADFKWPLLAPAGFHDDGHASGTGHYKGGVFSQLPFAGAFGTGGIVPGAIGAPAAAIVHGGERITPPGAAPNVRVFIGTRELTDIVRVEIDEHDRETSNAYAAGVA